MGLREDYKYPAYLRVPTGHPAFCFSDAGDFAAWCAPDILHGLPLGIFKHIQVTFYESLPLARKVLFDANVRAVSRVYRDGVVRFDSFYSVIAKLKVVSGRGRESLMRMLLVCIKENVVPDALERAQIIESCERWLKIYAIVRGRPTAADIVILEKMLLRSMDLLKVAFPTQKSGWSMPKFHNAIHFVAYLRFWGETQHGAVSPLARAVVALTPPPPSPSRSPQALSLTQAWPYSRRTTSSERATRCTQTPRRRCR